MGWQEQEPRIGHDTVEAETAYEGATATTWPQEKIDPFEPVATLRMRQETHNPPCVIQPRGADLVLSGEIDLRNVDEIQSHVLAWLHDGDNHLDCTGVDFIDSMGLSMILHVRTLAVQRGAHLLISCSPAVHLVLAMAGLTESLPGLTVTRDQSD